MQVGTDHRLYMVSRRGAKQLGPHWPSGASYRPKFDRAALIFEDRRVEVLKVPLHEALLVGRKRLITRQAKSCVVARPIGEFADGFHLYKPVEVLAEDGFDLRSYVADRSQSDRYRRGTMAFKVAKPKDGDEEGSVRITGMASSIDVDRDGEIVEPKAFEAKIGSFLANPIMLLNHDAHGLPIGNFSSIEFTDKGIAVEGVINDPQVAKIAKRGDIRMFSIGFMVDHDGVDMEKMEDGSERPRIKSGELLEVSIVTIPSNRAARFDVIKSARAQDPECWIGDCAPDHDCGCEMPAGVLEYRPMDAVPAGEPFDASKSAIEGRFGSDGWKSAHAFRDAENRFLYQCAAVVDGSLTTVPELVRLSMAQLVAGDYQHDDRTRQIVWSMIGKRWMECFPGEPLPTIEEHKIDRTAFARLAGQCVSGICFPRGTSAQQSKSWASARGLEGGSFSEENGMSLYKTATSEDGIGRVVTMPDGTKVFIAAGKEAAADEKPKEDDDEDEDEKAVKSPACREDGESEEDCVSRKVPELMDGEGMEEAQAVAAAGRMCSKPCSEKSADGPDDSDEDEDEDEDKDDEKSFAVRLAAVEKALAGKGSKRKLKAVAEVEAEEEDYVLVSAKAIDLFAKAKKAKGETVVYVRQELDSAIEEVADAVDQNIEFEVYVEPAS